jgi:glyoxylase-like metal-dependent hydrolase (beta-lactamase superfamily II)
MKWLIGLLVILAALGGLAYWAVIDGEAPAHSQGEINLAAYRALVEGDAQQSLPTAIRIEFVANSLAPGFAAEAGAFNAGQRTFSYNSFAIVTPEGDIIVDGAVDRVTLNQMSKNQGGFDEAAYQRVLTAMEHARAIMITHEHLDHVMAVARHPSPALIAGRLQLTRTQLDGLPQHAPNGVLAPEIAAIAPLDLTTPQRIAPGVVAAAAPGHAPGEIVIYVRTTEREYLLIGDIAWVYDSITQARGRPRFIRWIMPAVDPDRPRVLRQLRELHDISVAEPNLMILPAHDDAYLRALVARDVLIAGFDRAAPAPSSN